MGKGWRSSSSETEHEAYVYHLDRDEMVINEQEYEHLLKSYFILEALIDAGVENWEGFEKAVEGL